MSLCGEAEISSYEHPTHCVCRYHVSYFSSGWSVYLCL